VGLREKKGVWRGIKGGRQEREMNGGRKGGKGWGGREGRWTPQFLRRGCVPEQKLPTGGYY